MESTSRFHLKPFKPAVLKKKRGLRSQNAALTLTRSHKLVFSFSFPLNKETNKRIIFCRDYSCNESSTYFAFHRCHYSYNMHNSELIGSVIGKNTSLTVAWCWQGVPNKVAGDLLSLHENKRNVLSAFAPCELFNFQKKISH